MRVNITAKATDEGVKYLLLFATSPVRLPITVELDRKQLLNLSNYLVQAYYDELEGPVEI